VALIKSRLNQDGLYGFMRTMKVAEAGNFVVVLIKSRLNQDVLQGFMRPI
jgi:hypothetical protein